MTDTPWKTDDWFTSPWNFAPEVTKDWKFPDNIRIHDVTLRDGEQQAGLAFDYDDKIRIAEGLAEVGVQRIEAGMPVVSKDDARVVQDLEHLEGAGDVKHRVEQSGEEEQQDERDAVNDAPHPHVRRQPHAVQLLTLWVS